jgi:hypothetical protein
MSNNRKQPEGECEMAPDNWIHAIRWIARTLGLLYFAFISWFVVAHALGDGLPNLRQAPAAVQIDFLALFLMTVGGIVGWKWEGVAAVMVLIGTGLWLLVEQQLPWPPGLSLLIGVLYAFSWWYTKRTFILREHATQ